MENIRTFEASALFPGCPPGTKLEGWASPSPYTPKADPRYVLPPWAQDIVVWLLYGREPLYLFGPTGCGKTSCIRQVVQKLNYPVYEVTGHSRLEFPEMVGHHTVFQGSMHYEYGPLAQAMRHGGLFLLNEIDLLDPSTAAGLNSVLDGYPLTIPENNGELIMPHPMFKFAATANTNGGSDPTGLYQGVLRQNIAFMDRFVMVEAGYMAESQELGILKNYVGGRIAEETLVRMLRLATAVRRLFLGDRAEEMDVTIEITFSTRTLIRWALLIVQYRALGWSADDLIACALDRALAFRAFLPSRMIIRELMQRIFG